MKFYSDTLNKVFDTEEELEQAEKEFEDKEAEKVKKSREKKTRANEIEEAYKEYQKVKEEALNTIKTAEEKYLILREKFIEDYGSFHMSYCKNNNEEKISVGDLIEGMFLPFKNLF